MGLTLLHHPPWKAGVLFWHLCSDACQIRGMAARGTVVSSLCGPAFALLTPPGTQAGAAANSVHAERGFSTFICS